MCRELSFIGCVLSLPAMADYPGPDGAKRAFAERLCLALEQFAVRPHEYKRMADLFEVTPQAASKWVDGTNMPTRERMAHVADVLGVRRAWLEYGEGPMHPRTGIADPAAPYDPGEAITLDPREVRLLYAYRALDPSLRDSVDNILGHLAGRPPPADGAPEEG